MADDSTPIRRRNFLMGAGTAVAASLAAPVAPEAQKRPILSVFSAGGAEGGRTPDLLIAK